MYLPGKASRANLNGGCDDIIRLVMRAFELTEIDFSVIETKRTEEMQRANITNGVSWTMDSDHLEEDPDGSGVLAVDLYPWVDGETSHDPEHYKLLAKAMFKAAGQLGIQIKWGGFWKNFDGPHFAKRRGT
ncbi:MAG: hypothetical protein Unbinned7794contig1000_48 [Prokaryotic dsDNA virus sp.]|nr:MAG: hypothetical protein Unbinned7794contig1000_48 [Prokaryotic dsDNA virus sp.]|tara:strand:+ start:2901 stop:3293 length:393 start_codon:yes stop_codon:yes gene_type:complete